MATNLTFKEQEKNRLKADQLLNAAKAALLINGGGGGGNKPGEDGPYRPPNPDEVPGVPPGYPHIPKLAHGPGQEDIRDKFSYRTDGVLMIDPKRDGTLRPASTDEERDYQRQRFEHEEHPYKYLEHEHSDDYGLKISPKLANIPESYKRENIGGTLRDVMLPLLIKNYGKGPDGKYQDPDKLIEMMGKLKGV